MSEKNFLSLVVENYMKGYEYLILVDSYFNIFKFKLKELNFGYIKDIKNSFDYELKNNHYRFI